MITLWIVSCGVLVYTGFCRLVRTSSRTRLPIRLAIYLLTVAALCCAGATLVWGYQPGWPAALLAAGMAGVQVVTSVLWRDGVPAPYRGREFETARGPVAPE